jgi:hypothetical protein
VAVPSKAWVYGLKLAAVAGSNPARGIDVCLLLSVGCCRIRRADHSYRGVLPSEVCLSVIEEPRRGGLGLLGLSGREKKFQSHCVTVCVIYLLTEIGLPPGGGSTVHIYTQTIHRSTQNKQYIEQHKHIGRVRAVPRLCELYLSICLTTEEKARKNTVRVAEECQLER